jgi:hypothetical protein
MNNKHPVYLLIKTFKRKFYKQYQEYLNRNCEEAEGLSARRSKQCSQCVQYFLGFIVSCLVRMYSIDVKMVGSDPKKDLLVNLVTRFVLSDEVYFLVHNLISVAEQDKLYKIQSATTKLSHLLDFEALKIKP